MDSVQLPAGGLRDGERGKGGPELSSHPIRDTPEARGALRDISILHICGWSLGHESFARERRNKVEKNK